ncbi:MAG: dockerin type I domain-containing protein, partial [Pirellulaceae bacterium]
MMINLPPGAHRNYDTNGDGYVTAADALTVINALNNPEDPSAPNVESDAPVFPCPPVRTNGGCIPSDVISWDVIPFYDDNVVDMNRVFADDSEGEYRGAKPENT